jgi:hypothetical protein
VPYALGRKGLDIKEANSIELLLNLCAKEETSLYYLAPSLPPLPRLILSLSVCHDRSEAMAQEENQSMAKNSQMRISN